MQEIKVIEGEVFSINGVLFMRIGNNIARVDMKKVDGKDTPVIKATSEEIIDGEKRSVEIHAPCLNMNAEVHQPI